MRRAGAFALLAVLAAGDRLAAGDLFAGYSSLRSAGDNVSGAGIGLTWRSERALRYGAELASQFGQAAGESYDALALLGGPALVLRQQGRLRPFVHARAGGLARRRQVEVFGVAIGPEGVCDGGCPWELGPAVEAGGGLDVQVTPRLAVRLPQADYRWAWLGGQGEHGLRLSAGLVYRLP